MSTVNHLMTIQSGAFINALFGTIDFAGACTMGGTLTGAGSVTGTCGSYPLTA